MGGRWASCQEASRSEDEGTSADTRHDFDGLTLPSYPVEIDGVMHLTARALPAGVDKHVEGRAVGERMMGLYGQPLRTLHQTAHRGQRGHIPAVSGEVAAPVGENFPRTNGIKLFDIGEEHDPNLAACLRSVHAVESCRRCTHRRPHEQPEAHEAGEQIQILDGYWGTRLPARWGRWTSEVPRAKGDEFRLTRYEHRGLMMRR